MPKRLFGSKLTVVASLASLLLCVALLAAEDAKSDARKEDAKTTEPDSKEGDVKDDAKKSKERLTPKPELKPDEVVRTVIEALKANDDKDGGIAITFDFASPANQEMTGPLERFIPMVKSPAYAPMLNHKSAEYGKLQVRDDLAQQLVTIVDAEGNEAAYVFRLSKQADGDRKGCWLTDGVIRVEPGQEPGLDVPNDGKSERA